MNVSIKIYYLIWVFLTVLLSPPLTSCAQHRNKETISINGKLEYLTNEDSVNFTMYDSQSCTITSSPTLKTTRRINDGKFNFVIYDIKNPHHLDIGLPMSDGSSRSTRFLIEPGDSISISYIKDDFVFEGKGSTKYSVANTIYKSMLKIGSSKSSILDKMKRSDSLAMRCFEVLELNKHNLSKEAYEILKMDLIADITLRKLIHPLKYHSLSNEEVITVLNNYENPTWNRKLENEIKFSKSLTYSFQYVYFLLEEFKYYFCQKNEETYSAKKCYSYFYRTYSGVQRERIIFYLLKYSINGTENTDELVDRALLWFKNPKYRQEILDFRRRSLPGVTAYNFKLTDQNGKTRHLSDFKGRVVLLDFWFTGCKNCIDAHPYIDSLRTLFKNRDVAFISINWDKTKNTWLKSVSSGLYTATTTTVSTINLNTGNTGDKHPVVKNYIAGSPGAPTFRLIDKRGKLLLNPKDPRGDKGVDMAAKIEAALK
ncbi:TlpA family protein disulfide reductase [Pedobacter sp. AK017]|uniref:TlpA family protein disulfide reductase n=1 Tax=Pedobacter sp. AK017 TaxID=2723073 RepID=UPI00161D6AEE|nr:TlpA disulfide reductase family protein [Pedobacter sp. AK017]